MMRDGLQGNDPEFDPLEARLHAQRLELSAVELDEIKQRARARALKAGGVRMRVKSKLVAVLLAAGLVGSGGGAVIAASGGSSSTKSAAKAQYCPPSSPGAGKPKKPGKGNNCGKPRVPLDRPVAAGSARFGSLTAGQFLSQRGFNWIFVRGGYVRTFVAPGPGVYRERIYALVPVATRSRSARAAARTKTKRVLIMTGRGKFERAGIGDLWVRLTKRGKELLRSKRKSSKSLRIVVKTQFQRTRNGRVTTRQTSTRRRTVSKKGTGA